MRILKLAGVIENMYDDTMFDLETSKKFNRDIINVGGIESCQRQSLSIPRYGDVSSKTWMNNTISNHNEEDVYLISPTSSKLKNSWDDSLNTHLKHERKSLGTLSRSGAKFRSIDRNSFALTFDGYNSNFGKN